MRRATFLLGVVSLAAVGCRATIPNDTFACSTDDQCPEGYSCVAAFCNDTPGERDGGGRDAGPGTDAGERDGGPRIDGGPDAGSPLDAGVSESTLEECGDAVDNDGNGDTDCDDVGCCGSGACVPGLQACDCPALVDRTAVTVTGTVPASTEWTCDELYTLVGVVNVEAGDLTVHPGTVVLAQSGAGLFIERDARLLAVGTEARPILFTSAEPVGSRAPGDWYGVFVFGQAPINDPSGTSTIPSFPSDVVTYGGTDPTHDCGHVEYANFTFGGQDQNVNLAFLGCGTGTQARYVHTAHSLDTNLFVAGGTVNLDHVVSWASRDEGLLYSEGWVGSAQYVFVGAAQGALLRGRTSFFDPARTPFSTPQIWNATLTGNASSAAGVDLLSGAGLHMGNSIIAGISNPGACFEADATSEPRIATDLDIRHSITWNCGGTMGFGAGTESTEFVDTTYANRFVDPMLSVATPVPGSPPTTGATAPPAGLDPTSYLGAFEPAPSGTNDWSDGWADYAAN